MGFGNIGIGELMVIFLIVMVIFGPKRLPEIARNMGKFMRDFRRETNAAIKELKDGIEPVKVGIFDEPDAGAAAQPGNGASAYQSATVSPGASAAGGAGELAVGNHDLEGAHGREVAAEAEAQLRRFGKTHSYYAARHGPLEVFVVDSGLLRAGGHGAAHQLDWLEGALAASTAPWRAALM
ncbi:MAG: twin-arginine translocase TatA/TatE family subunit, partial [Actinomycetota bacterium]